MLVMITEDKKAKDGEIINKDGIKDGKIIKVIDKIKMTKLVEMHITGTTITWIITIKIMEIDKEGTWNVFAAENKDIKGMIVYDGNNI